MYDFSAIPRNSLMGKLARMPLKLIPAEAVVPIVQGPLKGRRWIAGSLTHGCWLGSYEKNKQQILARMIRPGMVCYDVGANVGLYTMLFSVVAGSAGQVHSFEPLPSNVEYLKRHIALNSLRNAVVHECAIADGEGEVEFEVSRSNAMGRIVEHSGGLCVRMTTLDKIAYNGTLTTTPDIIKIDVEGAEHRVLMGATNIVREKHPIILVATHGVNPHRDTIKFLKDRDYQVELIEPDEVLAVPRPQCRQ